MSRKLQELKRLLTRGNSTRSVGVSQINETLSRGRKLQKVRPGLMIRGILQSQIPLLDGRYTFAASIDELYAVYAKAAKQEYLSRPVGKRIHRKVMSLDSFNTFFRFACLLKFVEQAHDGLFRITELGHDAWHEWEDLRRAWQLLARGKKVVLGDDATVAYIPYIPKTQSEVEIVNFHLSHQGVVWLCLKHALKQGLVKVTHTEAGWLSHGLPDLILEDKQGTRFYAVEVKPRGSGLQEALRGIGQCASYKCDIPNIVPCLVIPERSSWWVNVICGTLSFNWISVITFNDSGEFRLLYGKDSFI